MALPKWNDPKLNLGTMKRTALWLMSEVGVGNSFTKEQHRRAFSGVTQADRRLRDLRDYGWVIRTSIEDVTLNPDEQRFVAAGRPVWERGIRKYTSMDIPTAKVRMTAFGESNYQCTLCGVAGGERYPDAPHMTAVLSISRRTVTGSNGLAQPMFVCECQRCRSGAVCLALDISSLLASIDSLDPIDRAVFIRWADQGRRATLDRLWSEFRRLSLAARSEVRVHLNNK